MRTAILTKTNTKTVTTKLGATEKTVREELQEKAAIVDAKDELQYPTNGEEVSPLFTKEVSLLHQKIERATKPRAYPLFLAEKGAMMLEDIISPLFQMGGEASTETERETKERIVILGTGWGSAAFLKDIDTSQYDVTVISPRNHFLFTPMLAGASVGTVEFRSITESIREVNLGANYLEGTAIEIDPKAKKILCESVVCEGNTCGIDEFTVEYDKLIMAVGAQTNTYGIPGVRENCCFLKQIQDARRIRTAIVNLFERANLPDLTDDQRKAILTFAVIGAGPTGVEFASELRDFIEQDGPKYYPNLLKFVRIKVIEASPTVLAPFDKSLQKEAIKQLTREVNVRDPAVFNLLPEKFKLTELLLNSGVSEVRESNILLNDGTEIPYGLAVWAAGNGPLPITLNLIQAIEEGKQSEAQSVARGRIAVDPWLRVIGGNGDILALGDCSCIVSRQLPATAQVASQQGEYLARLLSQNYDMCPGFDEEEGILLPPQTDTNRSKTLSESIAAFACQAGDFAAPFQFLNLGVLAYTGGGSALAQLQLTPAEQARLKGTGKIGFTLWRSVYLAKQVSWRNRVLVFFDWAKNRVFGRDITR
eukprot:CAMPEP_0176497384 /NCGR_PEP_ID=MMETSP0200_2-20121128/11695_1 /TAXON_ID=947934 /ORGANISM="Chaetoceros sp., Strain GSL56" /LENGTH=592 /DNA_ID=CAMNT_0017895393 /DNA_START=218 /DNA_END=1993 /DNA_ORIENTATION=-